LPHADIVTANLTGALLRRAADHLLRALRPGGHLIASGVLEQERDEVVQAFRGVNVVWEQAEDQWVGLIFRHAEKS
jgi:ribosomal protein L11 methyltransferase